MSRKPGDKVIVSMDMLDAQYDADLARERRTQSVRILLDDDRDPGYVTLLAIGHRPESDYERECREARTPSPYCYSVCTVREDGGFTPVWSGRLA